MADLAVSGPALFRPYEDLIEATFSRPLGSGWRHTFGERWIELFKRPYTEKLKVAFDAMKEALYDSTLVDLGGGNYFKQVGYKFSQLMGCKSYVVVDKYLIFSEQDATSKPQLSAIEEDMLRFVSRQGVGDCNFMINGIDNFIVVGQDYHEALARELTRVTRPGRLVFGLGSDLFEWLNPNDWRDLSPNTDGFTKVFQRNYTCTTA